MTMGCPSRLYANAYPANFTSTWPIAEGYFNTRYVWAHVEFTPQQTMRGKTALYGYLYGIGKAGPSAVRWNGRPGFGRHAGNAALIMGNNTILLPGAGTYTVRIIDVSGRTLKSFTQRIESKEVLHVTFPRAARICFIEIRAGKQVAAWKLLMPMQNM
jgi:hypothetical protein